MAPIDLGEIVKLNGRWVTLVLAIPLATLTAVGAVLVTFGDYQTYSGIFPSIVGARLDSFLLIACGLAGVAALNRATPEDRFKVSIVTFALFVAAAMLFWWANSFVVTE